MTTGTIFALQRYSLHDGPGIRTTVFLKGCPLDCIWCHNPESKSPRPQLLFDSEKCSSCGLCVSLCGSDARILIDGRLNYNRTRCTVCGSCAAACPMSANEKKGETADVESIITEVKKDSIFYQSSGGGMTLSGGEPSMQPEFSLELLDAAKSSSISCAIETCGSGGYDFYREAAALGVLFLYDIKTLDDHKHREFCGVSNRRILENLELLFSLGADVILRLPLIPGYNDSTHELELLKTYLNTHSCYFRMVELLPYHNLGTAKEKRLGIVPAQIESGESHTERWIRSLASNKYTVQSSNI